MLEQIDQSPKETNQHVKPMDQSKSLWSIGLQKILRLGTIFIATVLIPTTLSIFYFGFIASDVYISESEFVVRSPDKAATSGLGFLLKSAGFSNSGEVAYAAQDYIKSRDALRAINSNKAFERAYSGEPISIFNRFNPMGWSGSFEDLYDYFKSRVTVTHDSGTAITSLKVRAYDAKSAARFNEQLLEMAEGLVNRLNTRGRNDLISFAQQEVDKAKKSAILAGQAVSDYRNRFGVVDPEKQAAIQLQMISKLQDELIASRTQLAELQNFAPINPQIATLRARAASLSQQIAQESGKVAGNRGSLVDRAVQYQRLALENEFAAKQLAASMASLEEARNEARRKQAYVERIVQPNAPDSAEEPRRVRGIVVTFVMGLVAWGVLSMLLSGVREHRS